MVTGVRSSWLTSPETAVAAGRELRRWSAPVSLAVRSDTWRSRLERRRAAAGLGFRSVGAISLNCVASSATSSAPPLATRCCKSPVRMARTPPGVGASAAICSVQNRTCHQADRQGGEAGDDQKRYSPRCELRDLGVGFSDFALLVRHRSARLRRLRLDPLLDQQIHLTSPPRQAGLVTLIMRSTTNRLPRRPPPARRIRSRSSNWRSLCSLRGRPLLVGLLGEPLQGSWTFRRAKSISPGLP